MQPELIVDARANLGEGSSWDAVTNRLFWVDIHSGVWHGYDPRHGSDYRHSFDEPVSCSAPCNKTWLSPGGSSGDAVLALKSGIILLNQSSDDWDYLAQPETHLPGNRFNDGKCDPAGRFLVGTMDNTEKEASGSLYSYSPAGTLKTLLNGVRISNGLTWSPDYKTFYYIDTPTRQVTAFDYDLASGDIANPRPAVVVPSELGWPDGMTADAEGMLWVAMWGGAKLTRWNPSSGQLLEAIPIPALNVTSCVFGGQGLTDLYLTSARKGMSTEQLINYPLSGGLFRIQTNIRGLPTFEFGRCLPQRG
jgi:sugar lactone lactonase YvrE